jgi:ArsR family transcriptional regulator, arsenate/arsenite/antimonite-responsive transcriptional repressor
MDSGSVVAALGALAQETRLAAFTLLAEALPEGVPAGEIARKLGVPPNTMSNHLSVLAREGIVIAQRESRVIRYRANLGIVEELSTFLNEFANTSQTSGSR